MSLEKKLAEIEVLAKAMSKNVKTGSSSHFENFVVGVISETQKSYDKYRKARKAIRRHDDADANRYVGEFAESLKNLANNLNKYEQHVYSGVTEPDLRRLEQNTKSAPIDDCGKSLCDLLWIHDYSKENPLTSIRNMNGHGDGHIVLTRNGKKYNLNLEDKQQDAKTWLDDHATAYFDMVADSLRLMYDKDPEHFNKGKLGSIALQRAKNYVNRHKRTAMITAAAALLSAGVIGGYYGHQLKDEINLSNEHHHNYSDAAWVLGTGELIDEDIEKDRTDSIKHKVLLDLAKDIVRANGPDTTSLFYRGYNTNSPIFKEAHKQVYFGKDSINNWYNVQDTAILNYLSGKN